MDSLLPISLRPASIPRISLKQLQSKDRYYELHHAFSNQILWFDPKTKQKAQTAIVYFPGFTAGNGEALTLLKNIGKELRCNILITRTASSGIGYQLAYHPIELWLAEVEAIIHSVEELGQNIIVMGASTGATLALYLHQQFPDWFTKVVLSSINLGVSNKLTELLGVPGVRDLLGYAVGNQQIKFKAENSYQADHWQRVFELRQFAEVMKLVKVVRSAPLVNKEKVFFQCHRNDTVIDQGLIKNYAEKNQVTQSREFNFAMLTGTEHNLLTAEFYKSKSSAELMTNHLAEIMG